MIVKYVDFGGDPQECTGVQFQELYLAGKVPPEQTVLANGEPMEALKLVEIIEYAKDEALLKAARKAKLEEEQFQKTAPWWLHRNARWLITLGITCAALILPKTLGRESGKSYFISCLCGYLLWLFYYHVCGAKRYNNILDLVRVDEHQDIINQIEEKRRAKEGKNGGDKDGGKDHS